jgi:hypothetical protein
MVRNKYRTRTAADKILHFTDKNTVDGLAQQTPGCPLALRATEDTRRPTSTAQKTSSFFTQI